LASGKAGFLRANWAIWKRLLESGVESEMGIPQKLRPHLILSLIFLGLFCEASHFVEFWDPYGGLPYRAVIKWGLRGIFLVLFIWFGCKAFVLLRDDDPRNNRRR
jgi:hypothetical protein